ncbi:peptidase S8/S53 domain-containing protein [Microdochium bolleyi]|uniref:Peptidase S8/S53 domain-containing protein n=1 Tax=Microdochium bolleyi TaxID=196109 RepID=A0A136IV26_9PEZI|nr:peptidase S8/S53 domain-containing protein [Microdochium bolleyi]
MLKKMEKSLANPAAGTTPAGRMPDYTVPHNPRNRISGYAHQAMICGEHVGRVSERSGGSGGGSSSQGSYTYLRHDSAGEGITVFIMDTGFDVDSPAVQQELRLTKEPPTPQRKAADEKSTTAQPAAAASRKTSKPLRHSITEHSYIVPKDIAMGTDCPSSIIPGRYDTLGDTSPEDIQATTTTTSSQAAPKPDKTRGHGTQLASLALGTRFGIAPHATPYLVKVDSMAWDSAGSEWQYGRGSEPARHQPWEHAFEHTLSVIERRSLQGKAVVLCSMAYKRENMRGWGYDVHGNLTNDRACDVEDSAEDKWQEVFGRQIAALGRRGVAFVCSAGNNGRVAAASGDLLDSSSGSSGSNKAPGRLSRRDDVRIGDCVPGRVVEYRSSMTPVCVGAVEGGTGRLWGETSREGSRIDGRVGEDARCLLFAPGTDISCMGYAGAVDEGLQGTSYAAAIVAGLIASILSHESSRADPDLQWPAIVGPSSDPQAGYTVLNRLRRILLHLSRRHPLSASGPRARDADRVWKTWDEHGARRPDGELEINIAYNGARG